MIGGLASIYLATNVSRVCDVVVSRQACNW